MIAGTVKEEKAARTYLSVLLNCGSNSGQVGAILLDLEANKDKQFSQLVSLQKNLVGDCTVKTNLNEINTNNPIETKEFTGFTVSKDLNGQFEINKKELQLGEILTINGRVTSVNGQLINGILTLYYKQNANILFVDNTKIISGEISYNKSMGLIPTGNYDIDLEVYDNSGNYHYYEKIYSIIVSGSIEPVLNFDKSLYDPGDTVTVNGIITGSYNKLLKDISVEFTFDNKEKTIKTLKTSADPFSLTYKIPKDAKTGQHMIDMLTKNNEGNYGQAISNFTVRAIPTTLTITPEKTSILPEEDINFELKLLDQAVDPINENILTGLIDNNDKVIDTKVVKTNTKDSIKLPKSAMPGSWKLRAEGLGLRSENSFNVQEKKAIEVTIEGNVLHVLNIGNVEFKEPLEIQANNTNFKEELSIKVGKTSDVKLEKLLPNGIFDVYLSYTKQTFNGVRIDKPKSILEGLNVLSGNVASNVASNLDKPERKIGLYAIILLLVGMVVFLALKKKGKSADKYEDYQRSKDYELGKRKLEELRKKGIRKDFGQTQEYGKATQEDIEDFRNRMQSVWNNQEKKKSETEFVNQQQKNINQDKPSNYFGKMFD